MNKAISKVKSKTKPKTVSKSKSMNIPIPKCEHIGCNSVKMVPKDNKKTPVGLFACPKCNCLYRICGSDNGRKYIALVTRNGDCFNKEHPELSKTFKLEKKTKKKNTKKEEE